MSDPVSQAPGEAASAGNSKAAEVKKPSSIFVYDEWKSADNLEKWKALLSRAAANTLIKDQRINIRISQNDLDNLRIKAAEEGIPYQTLVVSVLHKYLTGKYTENQSTTPP